MCRDHCPEYTQAIISSGVDVSHHDGYSLSARFDLIRTLIWCLFSVHLLGCSRFNLSCDRCSFRTDMSLVFAFHPDFQGLINQCWFSKIPGVSKHKLVTTQIELTVRDRWVQYWLSRHPASIALGHECVTIVTAISFKEARMAKTTS